MNTSKSYLALFLFSFLFVHCKRVAEHTEVEKTIISKNSGDKGVTLVTSFQKWFKNPVPMISAHRGGPYTDFPENAIETFENVIKHTAAVIECDVAMTKDSVLVLMHDKSLDRTTTGSGVVTETLYKDLQLLELLDNEGNTTAFKIPTLDEVLAWGKGKALFTLDVKRGVPFEKVIEKIEKHSATFYAAIITYRIPDAKKVYDLNNKVIISVSLRDKEALAQLKKTAIPSENILAFVGTREPEKAHYEKLQKLGIKTILGTLGNLDKSAVSKGNDNVYLKYFENGADIIATDRPLEVAKILKVSVDKKN